MINLLSPDQKHALSYARHNSRLRKVVNGLLIGVSVLVIVAAGNFLVLKQDIDRTSAAAEQTRRHLATQNETQTINRMKEIRNTIDLAVDVLSGQVRYVDLFQQIGSVIPSGAVLQNLSLSGDMTGAIDLQIGTLDQNIAAQALVNLMDEDNKIFEKADLNSVICSSSDDESAAAYPCVAQIRAIFVEDSQFSFLGNQLDANRAKQEQN